MKTRAMTILAGLLMLARAYAAPPAATTQEDKADVAKSCNAFAMDMYAQLAAKPGNLFFSPASIDTALGMTYAGATGQTADQMAKTLHFTLPGDRLHPAYGKLIAQLNAPQQVQVYDGTTFVDKPAYQLSVANALWGEKGYDFKQSFLGLLHETYKAGLAPVEFKQPEAARKTINDWVATQTKDKIHDLIPAGVLTADTRLVLTNAIYFKSNWANKFEKVATKDERFHVVSPDAPPHGKGSPLVPTMHQQARLGYAETEDVQVLSMPYKADQLDMVVLLPRKVAALADMEKSLGVKLAAWLKAMAPQEVAVTLPKFTFTSQFLLSDTLKAMGMTDAFGPKASFPGITTTEALFVTEVLHKAFVAVDEEGTEAAAATAVPSAGDNEATTPPKPKIFRADHPFVFLIRHQPTGTILFMGRVADPRG